ncbi:hypothetical protein R1flu_003464 [Riccia fluitans]|uniref:Uncharacterized protein n=1 Tax=Riccia fluitans TaxID=41844 RepID=A0ABD1YA26_9MARC
MGPVSQTSSRNYTPERSGSGRAAAPPRPDTEDSDTPYDSGEYASDSESVSSTVSRTSSSTRGIVVHSRYRFREPVSLSSRGSIGGSPACSPSSHSRRGGSLAISPSPRDSRGGSLAPRADDPGSSKLENLTSPLVRSRLPTTNGSGPEIFLRGKKDMTQQREVRLLYTRVLQYRFLNAKAEAASSSQKSAAEASFLLLPCKILASPLQQWTFLQPTHAAAVAGFIGDLDASMVRVPLTRDADPKAVKEALRSAMNVMNALEPSIHSLLPRAQSVDGFLKVLAVIATMEKDLLNECGDLLSTAAELEIEERSLSIHLVQLQRESSGESATAADVFCDVT